jgi:hypothetical protein
MNNKAISSSLDTVSTLLGTFGYTRSMEVKNGW